MYPIMSTGNTVIQSVNVLKEHGVIEDCIILSNLFCTPAAGKTIVSAFPRVSATNSRHNYRVRKVLTRSNRWRASVIGKAQPSCINMLPTDGVRA